MMRTLDGTDLVHNLRVWVSAQECGTVDLEDSAGSVDRPGTVRVYVDTGRTQRVAPGDLRTSHAETGGPPPPLLRCRWVLSCSRPAVRMQPHPLMAPVPACAHHAADCDPPDATTVSTVPTPGRPARALDLSTPHSARVYDYWLGGKDNYAVDREVGDRILRAVPRQRRHVRANRAFLTRVVRHLVGEVGIRQIVDVGSGLPTAPNVHEVAQELAPDTKVVYVDNDPMVLAHARALLEHTDPERVTVLRGDLRRPRALVGALRTVPALDLDRPVAVLMLALLMSIGDDDRPHRLVADLVARLPSGSYLAATHTTADLDPSGMDGYVRAAHEAGMQFTPRSRAEVRRFFVGLDLVEPGVVPVVAWRPDTGVGQDPHSVYVYAGVGRKD